MNKDKIKAVIAIERPQYAIAALLSVVAGIFLASRGNIGDLSVVLVLKMGILFWFINCVAHPINDYFDRDADKTGRPNAPISSGILSLGEVRIIVILNYIIAFILIAVLPPNFESQAFALLGLFLTYIYSAPPFRTAGRSILGPLSVSGVLLIPFLSGWLAINGWKYEPVLITVMLVFVLFVVAQRMVADIADMTGDKKYGRLTVPIQIGADKSFSLAFFSDIFAFSLFFIGFILGQGQINLLYIPFGAIAAVMTFSALINFKKDFREESARKISEMMMLPLFICIIGVIVGSI